MYVTRHKSPQSAMRTPIIIISICAAASLAAPVDVITGLSQFAATRKMASTLTPWTEELTCLRLADATAIEYDLSALAVSPSGGAVPQSLVGVNARQNGAGSGPPRKNVVEPGIDSMKESGWNHKAAPEGTPYKKRV